MNKNWLRISLLVVLSIFVCWPSRSGTSNNAFSFSYHGQKPVDGIFLLTPILPPQIGVELVSGPAPEPKSVMNCTVSHKTVLQTKDKQGPMGIHIMYLGCGKRTFAVRGMIFDK